MNLDQLNTICGNTRDQANRAGFIAGLDDRLRPRQILVQVTAQAGHESARFRYTREIWGPTRAQRKYEGAVRLGNTQPGDGKRFLGRSFMQVTGRHNYFLLTAWCHDNAPDAPSFVDRPAALELPKWATLGVNWYFLTRAGLLGYAEAGNVEMVTRLVNGGLNGYKDRLDFYHRTALVLLGYGPRDVRAFQRDHGLVEDGIPGPATRSAMHEALK